MLRTFNPDMLSLARDARGRTQVELARELGSAISQAKLSKIENGLLAPSDDDINALAKALKFRKEFFFLPHVRRSEPPTSHRKRKKLTKKDWAVLYAKAEIYRVAASLMLRSVELAPRVAAPPSLDPDEFGGRIEEIAVAIRQLWGLPRGPIGDMVATLESAGILVIAFDFGTELCDGFTQFATDGMPPVVFVNTRQPKDRLRFTLAHELGHIVMHRVPNPGMETEANRFASEFLMPTKDIAKDLYNLSLDRFLSLKPHWKVSIQSLIYKAHSAGKISESAFRYYMTALTKKGWRSSEPVEINVVERPRIVDQLVRSHLHALQYTVSDLAVLTGLHEEEVEELFGLKNTPKLRLVV